MKPNEIKKAFECCLEDVCSCEECPYFNIVKDEGWFCTTQSRRDALAYINQLEAEVERLLQKLQPPPDVDPIDFCGVVCDFAEELIGKAKSETIKEFVKQAEKKRTVAIHCDVYEEVVRLEDLKEMEVANDTV